MLPCLQRRRVQQVLFWQQLLTLNLEKQHEWSTIRGFTSSTFAIAFGWLLVAFSSSVPLSCARFPEQRKRKSETVFSFAYAEEAGEDLILSNINTDTFTFSPCSAVSVAFTGISRLSLRRGCPPECQIGLRQQFCVFSSWFCHAFDLHPIHQQCWCDPAKMPNYGFCLRPLLHCMPNVDMDMVCHHTSRSSWTIWKNFAQHFSFHQCCSFWTKIGLFHWWLEMKC